MDIIEQIGAYGGLAAVLGLAVLSALYFSQARDVRRLREWAGRAPERVAEGAAAEQLAQGVAAQPQPKVVQEAQGAGAPVVPGAPGAKPATPGAKPTPATPGAKPAPATPAAKPVPAAAAAAAGAGPATADQKTPPGKPGAPQPKPGVPVATPAAASGAPAGAAATATAESAVDSPQSTDHRPQTSDEKPETADRAPVAPPAGGPPKPPGPVTPPRRTVPLPSQGRATPSDTAIIPPRTEPSWFQTLLASPRYLVLAIAGVLIVGGALAFGVVQLTSDDEGGGTPAADQPAGGGGGGDDEGAERPKPAPVNPADVTVSVLNGTTVPGLAASIGDRVEANGFVLGNVDNSADQGARNESVVLFADGAEREAVAVGRKLGISQREPIDPDSQAIAGDASVVVITGTDLTQ